MNRSLGVLMVVAGVGLSGCFTEAAPYLAAGQTRGCRVASCCDESGLWYQAQGLDGAIACTSGAAPPDCGCDCSGTPVRTFGSVEACEDALPDSP